MNQDVLTADLSEFALHCPFAGDLRGARILITGATGLIGSVLANGLALLSEQQDLGLQLVCPVRSAEKAAKKLAASAALQIVPMAALHETTTSIDYIVHCAAPTGSRFFVEHPVETIDTVCGLTREVLELAQHAGVKSMVMLSSLEVYGQILDDSQPVTEDVQGYINPLDVRSSYSMGKRMAECLCVSFCQQHGVPVKIVRLAQTFGPGIEPNDNRVFAQFARAALNHDDIVLMTKGELCRNYCYTLDAVSGILTVLLKGENGQAYNLANESTYISVAEMAQLVLRAFSPENQVVFQLQETNMFSPVTKVRMSAQKLTSLGWQPRYGLQQMYERLINYLK